MGSGGKWREGGRGGEGGVSPGGWPVPGGTGRQRPGCGQVLRPCPCMSARHWPAAGRAPSARHSPISRRRAPPTNSPDPHSVPHLHPRPRPYARADLHHLPTDQCKLRIPLIKWEPPISHTPLPPFSSLPPLMSVLPMTSPDYRSFVLNTQFNTPRSLVCFCGPVLSLCLTSGSPCWDQVHALSRGAWSIMVIRGMC